MVGRFPHERNYLPPDQSQRETRAQVDPWAVLHQFGGRLLEERQWPLPHICFTKLAEICPSEHHQDKRSEVSSCLPARSVRARCPPQQQNQQLLKTFYSLYAQRYARRSWELLASTLGDPWSLPDAVNSGFPKPCQSCEPDQPQEPIRCSWLPLDRPPFQTDWVRGKSL